MSDDLKAAAEWACPLLRIGSVTREGRRNFAIGGGFVGDVWDALDETKQRLRVLQQYVLARLAADEAEREERERPIDEDWLRSTGWDFRGVFWYYSLPSKRELVMSQQWEISDVLIKNVASPSFVGLGKFTTRGQLLDLLKALKGGA